MTTSIKNHPLLVGSFFGISCALIWAGWILITSFSTKHQVLLGSDITFIRFGFAALLFLPSLMKYGINIGPKKWVGIGLMTIGAGPIYLLTATFGMACTNICHVGGLLPGTMPLFSTVLTLFVLKDKISLKRAIGLVCIITGVFSLTGLNPMEISADHLSNFGFLLLASFVFSIYTVSLKYWKVTPIQAAAIVSVFGFMTYLPVYIFFLPKNLFQAPLEELLTQGFYQGFMAAVLGIVFYGKAIEILGPARGSVFVALVPALATILAIPFFGEWPSPSDWTAIFILSFGVFLATGTKLSLKKMGAIS